MRFMSSSAITADHPIEALPVGPHSIHQSPLVRKKFHQEKNNSFSPLLRNSNSTKFFQDLPEVSLCQQRMQCHTTDVLLAKGK